MYTSYLSRTQKIEEIVTLNTLMKPIFNWGRLASEIVIARGWGNRDLVTRCNHHPGSTKWSAVLCHGLTHWVRVTQIYVSKLNIIGSNNNAWFAPSHYLHQCRNIVNSKRGNKLPWNLKRNAYIFIQENAFENITCEIAAILSRPRFVKDRGPDHSRLLLIHEENKALKYF